LKETEVCNNGRNPLRFYWNTLPSIINFITIRKLNISPTYWRNLDVEIIFLSVFLLVFSLVVKLVRIRGRRKPRRFLVLQGPDCR